MPQPNIINEFNDIIQTSDGTVRIEFEKNEKLTINGGRPSTQSNHSYISPLDYKIEFPPSRASTSRIREDIHLDNIPAKVDNLNIKENIVRSIYDTTEANITASEMNFSL